jgi:tetratricopeptide (TPR) repeat protein
MLLKGIYLAVCILPCFSTAHGHDVKDLKYGAILFEFYQQKYFETLVEYAYAAERGGIHDHGSYPELLKGGVSLSYGLDLQARRIFTRLISDNSTEDIQNRAWFYLAKMLYLRGDIERSAETMSNISGSIPEDINQEYQYLAALINIKLGYFDEAEAISDGFDDDSSYAPYLYFNLGVAFGKQKEYARAHTDLDKAASYNDGSNALNRLADRSHMAMAYLNAEEQNFPSAYTQIRLVSTTGVFSNRALLGSGWVSVNNGSYQEALVPLSVLQQRSMAIPEVQEAVLLVPHVYEKLGLEGRAAEGFISAYDRYTDTLVQLKEARESLQDADILELFVRNLDAILGESDWFGTAPSVSLNSLSPFLLDLMSDHSFQSVLKDLRDLYAIRNNLNSWKRRQDDFDVILESRAASLDTRQRKQNIESYTVLQAELLTKHAALEQRTTGLAKGDQKRVQWLLDDISFELKNAGMMVSQLHDASGVSMNNKGYTILVKENMANLDKELEKTNELIEKVENVLLELIAAELEIHKERLKYYRIQAHLAKARILDRSLAALDDADTVEPSVKQANKGGYTTPDGQKSNTKGGSDAP